jgi:precorrin-6B methylase 2
LTDTIFSQVILMTADAVRDIASRLSQSFHALAALSLALQSRDTPKATGPRLGSAIDGVIDSQGWRAALDAIASADIPPILAAIRSDLLIGPKFAAGSSAPTPGWAHTEDDLLQSVGEVSAGFPRLFRARILPGLTGLAERLSAPGASFLDIGTGVGALSIAMARDWPRLRIAALEPHPAALALARSNVAAADLDARVVLQPTKGEALEDVAVHDLVWVPSAFIPEAAIPEVVARAARALKPGGWMIYAIVRHGNDAAANALARFRTAFWGGSLLGPDDVAQLMKASGLTDARLTDGPAHSTIGMMVARRPDE